MNTVATSMEKIEVIGRNGYGYEATPIRVGSCLYVVGKYIVKVVDGKCDETVCKATKKMVAFFADPFRATSAI